MLLLVVFPVTAFAQGNPGNPGDFTNNPHPTMPWFGLPYPGGADYGVVPNRRPKAQDIGLYGTVVGYIQVPTQQVVINAYVSGPGSFSGEFEQQVVEIPGYFVAETTTGYLYPERWTLEQTSIGVYQWRVLPQFFTRK
ncbi:MAG: hypothetical protein HYY64_11730 [Candidatus Rokubacteria bacterium]|nr:hypothetical protein [Candidatus Rokubacteria bacterium]